MSKGGNKVATRVVYEDSKILELWNKGLSADKIRYELHTSIQHITSVLNKYNIKYGQEKQRIDKSKIDMIIDLYNLGYGTMDISRYLNVDKGTIRKYLKRNNIKIRAKEETNKLRRNLSTLN